MAVFKLQCTKCENVENRIVKDTFPPCTKCGGETIRAGQGPTSRIIEVRDNGLMPKKVEQLANLDDLKKGRS